MSVIDDYLKDNAEPSQRTELERVRSIAKQIVPEAEEVISYGVPTLKYKGKPLLYFAAYKDHLSVFPGPEFIKAAKDKLKTYKLSKGTIQFTEQNPLPEQLIREIVEYSLQRIGSRK